MSSFSTSRTYAGSFANTSACASGYNNELIGTGAAGNGKSPRVSVVVVAFNAGRYLQQCLRALERQSVDDFEVILVDNNSNDGCVEGLDLARLTATLIKVGKNLGFAAANNLAARQARGTWLATLNPDAFAAPDWLEQLMAAVDRHPGVVMFGSTQWQASDPQILDGAGDPYHPFGFAWRGGKGTLIDRGLLNEGEVFGPCAAAALYKRDLFLALGGFDERFFCYYEDVDLAFRIRLWGGMGVQVPAAQVTHVGSATTGKASDFSLFHITRNRIWTFVKNMPGPWLLLLAAPAMATLLQTLIFKPGHAKWRGLTDAFRNPRPVLKDRRQIQATRVISAITLATAMTWSLRRAWNRAPDIRRIPSHPSFLTTGGDLETGLVCAIMVTYHARDGANTTLPPLLGQVAKVVVVDNGSDAKTRHTLEKISSKYPGKMTLIYNDTNLGLARAQNQGITFALEHGFPWILLMDQDSVAQPGMVSALLRTYHNEPRRRPIGLLAPRINRRGINTEQQMAVSRHPFHFSRCRFADRCVIHDLLFAIASGSLIPGVVLHESGLMRDDFFIDYVDIDFCFRLRQAHYDIVAVSDAVLDHRLGATTQEQLLNRNVAVTHHPAFRRYYIYRNRIRLWRTYFWRSPAWLAFELAAVIHDLIKIIRFEQRRKEKLRYIAKGVWDGLKGVGNELPHAETPDSPNHRCEPPSAP